MATWKVARSSKVCALSGRLLAPGAHVVTALFGVEEEVSEDKVRGTGFVRKDFLADDADSAALATALDGAYCVWRTKLPPDEGHRAPRLDLAMARDLLERLVAEGDPGRASAAWTLAMLLVRKRQLTLVGEKEGALVLRWPKTEATFRVPATVVAEAEVEQLEQELSRLFEV
jgi:hypothetical protein